MERLGTRLGVWPPVGDTVTPVHLCAHTLPVLPNDFIYIGEGNVKWPLAPTNLSSGPSETMLQYSERILSGTEDDVAALRSSLIGSTLLCSCTHGTRCHTAVLVHLTTLGSVIPFNHAFSNEDTCQPLKGKPRGGRITRRGMTKRLRPLKTALAAASVVPQATGIIVSRAPWQQVRPPVLWHPHSLQTRIKGRFPQEWLGDVALPCWGDLVNKPPLNAFAEWSSTTELDILPSERTPNNNALARAAMVLQQGTMAHRLAEAPLVGHGSEAPVHVRKALSIKVHSCVPSFAPTPECPDLDFAAEHTMCSKEALQANMIDINEVLQELSSRCSALMSKLRSFQPETVAHITCKVDQGFICTCCIVMRWSYVRLPHRMVSGVATTGTLEESDVFAKQEGEPQPVTKGDWLAKSGQLIADMERAPIDEEVSCLWTSCQTSV